MYIEYSKNYEGYVIWDKRGWALGIRSYMELLNMSWWEISHYFVDNFNAEIEDSCMFFKTEEDAIKAIEVIEGIKVMNKIVGK